MGDRAAVETAMREVRVDAAITREVLELCGAGECSFERSWLRSDAKCASDVGVALG